MNSERIESEFGSFGIEVLERSARKRVSSLYSLHEGIRICRTYATVEFTLPVPGALSWEHSRVVSGESIGAVFKSGGWRIDKRPVAVGHMDLTPDDGEIIEAMRLDAPTRVALHRYIFAVTREGKAFDYAVITELHHPQYLTEVDFPADGTARGALPAAC